MDITYETQDIEERLNVMMTPGCFAGCCVMVNRGLEF